MRQICYILRIFKTIMLYFMNNKQKRLQEVYEYLRRYYGIHTQIDFANALQSSRNSITLAMNGNEAYLTKKLFQKICAAFPGVFNLDYLLTGEGALLVVKEEEADMPDIYERFDILKEINNAHKETIEALKSQMADLRMQLVDKQNVIETKDLTIKAQERTIELLNLQITGLKTEMRMKGVASYPFEMGVSEKLSAPDK